MSSPTSINYKSYIVLCYGPFKSGSYYSLVMDPGIIPGRTRAHVHETDYTSKEDAMKEATDWIDKCSKYGKDARD